MQILEYGNSNNDKVILIHGFQMPLDSLNEYINILKKDYFVIVPILPGHNPNDKEEFEKGKFVFSGTYPPLLMK